MVDGERLSELFDAAIDLPLEELQPLVDSVIGVRGRPRRRGELAFGIGIEKGPV
jgi:hypothetical protein